MLIVTTTLTRPSVDVPFYKVGDAWKEYVRNTYINTSMMVVDPFTPEGMVYSADELTLTLISHWRSRADMEVFLADATADAMKAARAAYSAEHGIQISFDRRVVFDEFDLEPSPT